MKKKCLTGLLAGLMLLSVVGCGSSSKFESAMGTADYAVAENAAAEPMEEAAEVEMNSMAGEEMGMITSDNGIESVSESNRKLIKTVYLNMQTKEFDSVLEGLTAKVGELGGYIENSSINGSSYYYETTRYASFTLRIPSTNLDEFVNVVGELGNVTQKDESVEDVTLEYVDTESRKKALEVEQERLLELLAQAENMEDLLAIESKLSEVRYQLENYGSQLRLLDNQINYSTVHLDVHEVERITETKERTFFEEISDRFNDSLYDVGRGLRSFTIGFIGSLPVLAVWAVILAVFVVILRKLLSGKKREKTERKFRFGRKGQSEEQE